VAAAWVSDALTVILLFCRDHAAEGWPAWLAVHVIAYDARTEALTKLIHDLRSLG